MNQETELRNKKYEVRKQVPAPAVIPGLIGNPVIIVAGDSTHLPSICYLLLSKQGAKQ